MKDKQLDFSELDDQLEALAGYEVEEIKIFVPKMYAKQIKDWLANGERKTSIGYGMGLLKRCKLL